MGGSFACPECGQGIKLTGLTPGREVICPACSTLVEVPYLPRVQARPARWSLPGAGRGRRGSRRWGMAAQERRRLRWALALGAVLAIALTTWWAVGSIGSRARSDRERVLDELIAASDAARAVGNPGGAFREIEAAVILARKMDPDGSPRRDALVARRDAAARAEVAARLAALGTLEPDRGAGEAAILAERVRKDPALAALADEVAAAGERAIARQVGASLELARATLRASRAMPAFQAARRAHDQAGHLASPADAGPMQEEARAIIVATVERFGAALAAPTGDQTSAAPVDDPAATFWMETLTVRGYLLPPPDGAWADVWAAHAPYQAASHVVEARDELYLQSQNRATRIDGLFSLTRRGQSLWQTRVFAQTRSPIPDLPDRPGRSAGDRPRAATPRSSAASATTRGPPSGSRPTETSAGSRPAVAPGDPSGPTRRRRAT